MYSLIGRLVVWYGVRFGKRKAASAVRSKAVLAVGLGMALVGVAGWLARRDLPEG